MALASIIGGGSAEYAYVTARVRAMKTFLYPPDTYPKLLARDVHEIARFLQDGRYKEDIDAFAGRYAGGRLVELATRRSLGREFGRMLQWAQGEARMLMALYFARYDVLDAKTVLRAVQAGTRPEEIREILLGGVTVPGALFDSAVRAGNLEDAADQLSKVSAFSALAAVRGEPLPALEDALDRSYYAGAVHVLMPMDPAKQALMHFLRREIDIVNLKVVLRLRQAGVTDYAPIAHGLEIDEAMVRRILGAQPSEVAGVLDATSYGPVVRGALEAAVASRDLNPVVSALDRQHLETAQKFGHLYPLSILPVIDYVLRKRVEVENLRVIAVGKTAGLDEATLRGMVMA